MREVTRKVCGNAIGKEEKKSAIEGGRKNSEVEY